MVSTNKHPDGNWGYTVTFEPVAKKPPFTVWFHSERARDRAMARAWDYLDDVKNIKEIER